MLGREYCHGRGDTARYFESLIAEKAAARLTRVLRLVMFYYVNFSRRFCCAQIFFAEEAETWIRS